MTSSRATAPPAQRQAGTVRANLVALGAAEGVARLAQLLTIALLGRALGPEGLGIVGVAWAVFQLALPFVQHAPELMGARDVAQGADTYELFADVTAIKLVIGAVATLAMALGASIAFAGDPPQQVQVLLQAALPIAVALNGVWAFRGLRRFSAYAIVRSAHAVLLLAVLAAVLMLRPAPWIVPVVEATVGIAAAALAYTLLFDWRRRALLATMLTRGPRFGRRIGEAFRFGIGSFFGGAAWSVPLLIGRALLDPAEQGYLAAALRLMLAVTALYQLALQVFHPVLAHRYAADRQAGASLAAALVVYALVATAPVAALLIVFAPWFVTPLLGAAFAPASGAFAGLAAMLVPLVISSVFGYALLADGRYTVYVWICAGGAAAAVVACSLAFYIWPEPGSVGVLAIVTTAVAGASGYAAWRLGLVRFSEIHPGQLTPARIQKVLAER